MKWLEQLAVLLHRWAHCLFTPRDLGTAQGLSVTLGHCVLARSHAASEFSLVSVKKTGEAALQFNTRQFHILFLDTQIFIRKFFSVPEPWALLLSCGQYLSETNRWKWIDRVRPRCWGLPLYPDMQSSTGDPSTSYSGLFAQSANDIWVCS